MIILVLITIIIVLTVWLLYAKSRALSVYMNPSMYMVESLFAKPYIKIPKIIHQIWVGPKPEPTKWTDTWREYCKAYPDWTYKMWKDVDAQNIISRYSPQLLDIYRAEPTYYGKADILRLVIIYYFGGVYIDADTIWIKSEEDNTGKSLDPYISNCTFFAGYEREYDSLIANSVFGAVPESYVVKTLISTIVIRYWNKRKTTKPHKLTGPYLFTEIIPPLMNNDSSIKIHPYYVFYPVYWWANKKNVDMVITDKTFPNSVAFQYGLSTNSFNPANFVK